MGAVVTMILGWSGEEIINKAKMLNINLNPDDENGFDPIELKAINETLINIQRDVFSDVLGFKVLEEERNNHSYYFLVETPLGKRKCKNMELKYAEDMEDMHFGIRLNGVFTPVLMDWDEDVMGEGAYRFAITKEKMELFKKTKEKVSEKYPIFKDAEWIILSDWI